MPKEVARIEKLRIKTCFFKFSFSANSAANLWKITRPEQPNGEQATRFVPCWAHRKVVAKAMEKLEETESRDWSKDEIRIRYNDDIKEENKLAIRQDVKI